MDLRPVAERFTPDFVIDCGAGFGWWYQDAKHYWPNAEYFLIEAQEGCREALKALKVFYKIAVLSDSEKKVDFYELKDCPGATGASYYRENTPFFADDQIKVEERTTETLDQIVRPYFLDGTILLKADLQGAEIDMLLGAKNLLPKIGCVILEVAFTDYNQGAPKFNEVRDFMMNHGFTKSVTLGVIAHPTEGYHIQSDIAWFRE